MPNSAPSSSLKFASLLKSHRDYTRRVKNIVAKIAKEDFDNEDALPGHDSSLYFQLSEERRLYETLLRSIEQELRSLGWKPKVK